MKYLHFFFLCLFASASFAQQTGCISGDCKNGFGKFIYTPNPSTGLQSTYTGYFKNGYPNGKGEKVYVNTFVPAGLQPQLSVIETGIFDTIFIQGKAISFNNGNPEDTLTIADGEIKNYSLATGSFTKFIGGSKTGHYIKQTGIFGDNPKYTTTLHGWNGGIDIQYVNTDYNIQGICISGDCVDGEGTLLYNDAIFKGRFEKGKYYHGGSFLKEGTMEIYDSKKNYENGLYEIGKWKLFSKYDVNQTYALTIFHPLGTDEALEGFLLANDKVPPVSRLVRLDFQFRDFNYFIAFPLYSDGTGKRMIMDYGYKPKSSKWITEIYTPIYLAENNAIKINAGAAHDKQVQEDLALLHSNPVAYYYKYPDRDPNLPIPPIKNNGSNKGSSTNVNSNSNIGEHACPRCNGTGRDNTTDRYGNATRQTCGLCNGTGKVH